MLADPIRRRLFLRHLAAWARSDPYRNALSAAGLVIGVAGIVVAMALVLGESRRFLDRLRFVGFRCLYATASEGRLPEVHPDGLRRSLPGLERATMVTVDQRMVSAPGGKKAWAPLLGIRPEYLTILGEAPIRGRGITDLDVRLGSPICLVGSGLHQRLGEPLTVEVDRLSLRVVGVLEAPVGEGAETGLASADPGSALMVPAGLGLTRPVKGEPERHLLVQARRPEEVEELREGLQRLLARQVAGEVLVVSAAELLARYRSTRSHLTVGLVSMSALALLLGGLAILNNMLALVLERLPEIGVRIAMGAGRREIVIQFVAETLLITVAGSVAGLLLGLPWVGIIHWTGLAPVALPWWLPLVPAGIGILLGVICGALPAARAARARPIETLTFR